MGIDFALRNQFTELRGQMRQVLRCFVGVADAGSRALQLATYTRAADNLKHFLSKRRTIGNPMYGHIIKAQR